MNKKRNYLSHLFIASISMLLMSADCDGICNEQADLQIPETIIGSVLVAQEFRYTVVGRLYYPFGTSVFLTNTINEFYSVVRVDPTYGHEIIFYWNYHSPPPFYFGAPPPIHPLKKGEKVTVYRCVFNQAFPDFDCLTLPSKTSKTKMEVVVRVENGQILDQQELENQTPSIPPGQYQVAKFPITINASGIYDLKFKANSDHRVIERDTTNNTYISRPTADLGAGGN